MSELTAVALAVARGRSRGYGSFCFFSGPNLSRNLTLPHTPQSHAVFKREMKSMFFKFRGGTRLRYGYAQYTVLTVLTHTHRHMKPIAIAH